MTRMRAEAPLILLLGICASSLLTLLAALMEYEREDPATTVANKAFENEEYEDALDEYEEVSKEWPKRPEPDYLLANTQYRLRDYEKAEQELQKALLDADEANDEDLIAKTRFNLGNVLYQMEEYEEAIESYKEVLRQNPDDREAKHNLELAQSKLQEEQQQGREQQQEEQQQGQGDQPGPPDQPDDEGDEQQEGPDGDREGVGEDPEGEQRGDGAEQESQELVRPGENPEQQEMTPAQALQILEMVGQNTDNLQSRLPLQPEDYTPVERDW